ncbi:hypothetical protein AAFF_G00030380 [Aldrovandia affinis]|uniref:CBM21 domain-containing protein n=1 Tax=Aldrovandia affinis TaxID=143900 RepID=A0AAD7S4D0_9TELE|nr:hypothetical protein AAFF_G00030380 [Aldrovandia affinis]
MSCTTVLPGLGGRSMPASVMPMDLATMRLYLSQSPPLNHLLGAFSPKSVVAPRTLHHVLQKQPALPSLNWAAARSSTLGSGAKKKRVVFADAKGLALTAVRFFSEEVEPPGRCLSPPPDETALRVSRLLGPGGASQVGGKVVEVRPPARRGQQLWLGFLQPVADFVSFSARLQESLVLLESCSVTAHALKGRVRVRNIGFEKAVHVRITFDSWKSHHDVPCTHLHLRNAATLDTDLFTFNVPLPQNLDPRERLEFCISFSPGGQCAPLWDNNKGQNYRIHVCTEPKTTTASILTSHCSLTLPAKRKGSWVSLPRAPGHRLNYLTNSLSTSLLSTRAERG